MLFLEGSRSNKENGTVTREVQLAVAGLSLVSIFEEDKFSRREKSPSTRAAQKPELTKLTNYKKENRAEIFPADFIKVSVTSLRIMKTVIVYLSSQ